MPSSYVLGMRQNWAQAQVAEICIFVYLTDALMTH